MKNLSFTVFFLVLGLIKLSAQHQIIAVQNGDVPTFYTTLAFALADAEDGDTLYLPAGTFAMSGTIDKKLHFVGRGHYPSDLTGSGISKITGNILLREGADGSSFEGLYLDQISLGNGNGSTFITISDILISRCSTGNIVLGGQFADANNPVNNVTNVTLTECVVKGNIAGRAAQNVLLEKSIVSGNLSGFAAQTTIENCIFLDRPFTGNSALVLNNSIFLYDGANFLSFENHHVFNNSVFVYNFSAGLGNNTLNNCVTGVIAANIFENVSGTTFLYTHNYHLKESSPAIGVGTGGIDAGIYGPAQPYTDGITSYPFIHEISIPGTTDADGMLNVQVKVSARDY